MTTQAYWIDRMAEQGPDYVAKRGVAGSYERQRAALVPYLRAHALAGPVLDFGCGPGRFRDVLEERGPYTGLDIIPANCTVPWDGGDIPGVYRSAVAIMVLQHITDPRAYVSTVRKLHGCLEPGGQLLVVDHYEMDNPDPHMRPRGFAMVRECAPWVHGSVIGEYDGHWIGVFRT